MVNDLVILACFIIPILLGILIGYLIGSEAGFYRAMRRLSDRPTSAPARIPAQRRYRTPMPDTQNTVTTSFAPIPAQDTAQLFIPADWTR